MKILIAGLGSIGRRHLKNLQALGEQDILLYRTHRGPKVADHGDPIDAVLERYPLETDLEKALAHQPDAVIVANPTALHLEVAIPAARAGCHLLLEKPVSHSLDRLDELQAAVEQSGSRVLVGFQFRFHPGLKKVAELLSNGAIGRPLSVRAHWGEYLPGWHPWEDYRQGYSARSDLGGGVLLTLSHPFDYLRWLFGEVSSVWAFAARLSDLELDVEDTAEIGFRFKNGVLGSLHLDYNQRPSMHYLEIIGTTGSLSWNGSGYRSSGGYRSPGGYRSYGGDKSSDRGVDSRAHESAGVISLFDARSNEIVQKDIELPSDFMRNDLFLDEMRHFLAVARGATSPICSLEDGIEALRLALGARQSTDDRQLVELR